MAWLGRKLQIAIDVGRKSLVEALLLCVAIILESDENKKIGHIFSIQLTGIVNILVPIHNTACWGYRNCQNLGPFVRQS